MPDVRHLFVSPVLSNGRANLVQGPHWNEPHSLLQGPQALLGRTDGIPGQLPTSEVLLDPDALTFVDGMLTVVSGSSIPEAPADGQQYGRASSTWTVITPNPTTLPPSGNAGGDLTGTYPNPTLSPFVTLPSSAIVGFDEAVDDRVSALLVAGSNVTLSYNDIANTLTVAATFTGGGTGTVTGVSVVSANGLAGTVANAATTPAITLSTTISGMLKGNGTAISAAVAGTDYPAIGHTHSYLPIADPAFTGTLTGPAITTTGNITSTAGNIYVNRAGDAAGAYLFLQSDAGQAANLIFSGGATGILNRWHLTKYGAETGSNAGAEMGLYAYQDNGTTAAGFVWTAARDTRTLAITVGATVPTPGAVTGTEVVNAAWVLGKGYATTAALGSYLPLTGGTLTGALTGTTASMSGQVTTTGLIVSTLAGAGTTVTPLALRNSSGTASSAVQVSFDPGAAGIGVRDARIVATNNGSNALTLDLITRSGGVEAKGISIGPSGAVTLIAALTGTSAAFSSTLDVTGAFSGTTAALSNQLTITRADGATTALFRGATKGVRLVPNANFFSLEGVDNTGTGSFQPLWLGGSEVRFGSASTELMRLTTAGLGIGILPALAKLHVSGAGQSTAAFDPTGVLNATVYISDTNSPVGSGGSILFSDSHGPFAAIKSYVQNGTGPLGDLVFTLRRAGADATFTEAFRIASTGAVTQPSGNFFMSGGYPISNYGVAVSTAGLTQALVKAVSTNFGIYYGNGAPSSFVASKGSLYIQLDATTTTTRLWINHNASTGWATITTSA